MKTYTIFGQKVKEFELVKNDANLKKEMSDNEFEQVQKCIYNFFRRTRLYIHRERKAFNYPTKSEVDEIFGLPYTSTGDFAAFCNTNSELYLMFSHQTLQGETRNRSNFSVRYFALSLKDEIVCYCLDESENEFAFVIGALVESKYYKHKVASRVIVN